VGKKAVIILLVLCALLFLLALGSNWLPSAKGQKEDFSLNDYGWLNELDKWVSRLQKKVALSRLKPQNCNIVGKGRYRLSNDKTCIVVISSVKNSGQKDDKNARLLVVNTNKEVIFKVPCAQGSQGRGLGVKKALVLNPAIARIKTAPAVRIPGTLTNTPTPLQVQVAFSPANSSGAESKSVCEQKSPPKLMVFNDGGILKLTCQVCKANRTVEVVFE